MYILEKKVMKNICNTHGRIGVIGRWTSVRVWKPVVKSRMLLMVMVVSSVSPSHGPMAILMSVSNVHHLKSSITSAVDVGDRRPYLSRTYLFLYHIHTEFIWNSTQTVETVSFKSVPLGLHWWVEINLTQSILVTLYLLILLLCYLFHLFYLWPRCKGKMEIYCEQKESRPRNILEIVHLKTKSYFKKLFKYRFKWYILYMKVTILKLWAL